MRVEIPGFKKIEIKNIVFDYNGTLAKDGKVSKKTKELLRKLTKDFNVFVITADTFGSVKKELKEFNLEVTILKSKNHTKEKEEFVKSLNATKTITFGNGNNDAKMLKVTPISIAIMGDEGCSVKTLANSQIVCKDINSAIELLLKPKRLIATLRR